MPVEWALSILFSFFMWKGGIKNCSCYRAVKLLEHCMKVVEMVLEKGFVDYCLLIKSNLALCLWGNN